MFTALVVNGALVAVPRPGDRLGDRLRWSLARRARPGGGAPAYPHRRPVQHRRGAAGDPASRWSPASRSTAASTTGSRPAPRAIVDNSLSTSPRPLSSSRRSRCAPISRPPGGARAGAGLAASTIRDRFQSFLNAVARDRGLPGVFLVKSDGSLDRRGASSRSRAISRRRRRRRSSRPRPNRPSRSLIVARTDQHHRRHRRARRL